MSYLISQFRNVPEIMAVIGAVDDTYVDLKSKLDFVYNYYDLDKATGYILDYIGYLYGTTRDFFDISTYFRVNVDDVNKTKQFFFENPQSSIIAPNGSLSDLEFRQRIKAKIATVFSKKTRNENIFIIKNMTFADNVLITQESPMLLNIKLIGDNLFITDKIVADIEYILADGVGVNILEVENA